MDFKRLLHISGLGSWSWNPQSPLRQLDEHAAKICGFADAGMLRKVIDKLVHNALKFTTKGKVEVHCAFANSGFQIQIIDTGEGIATDLQEVIFSPFRKGDISASRAKEGSGLGLAVTKGFLKNMGGSIHLQSEVGRGSTFTVWLPVVPPASVALQ